MRSFSTRFAFVPRSLKPSLDEDRRWIKFDSARYSSCISSLNFNTGVLTTACMNDSSSTMICQSFCCLIHAFSIAHCSAFALSGFLDCRPRPESLLTQFGRLPQGVSDLLYSGTLGGLLQPEKNKMVAARMILIVILVGRIICLLL